MCNSMEQIFQREIKHRWQGLFLALLSLSLTSVATLEENRPAIFLNPRTFNHHPYEADFDPADSVGGNKVGPVVFPPAPSNEDNSVNNNFVTLETERRLNHPVDDHPYPKVARKHKYKFPGRFNDQSNDVNPRVYEALSKHAAKVLSEPASQLRKDYTLSSLSNQRKSYAFSYKVVDHLTGDDFSHTQSQNSRATNGEYRVKLPDGRVQIVSYIADKNGYKADVKYTENDLSSQNIQIQHQIPPIPVLKANSYDYQYDHTSRSHLPSYDEKSVLYAPLQSRERRIYDYNVFATTPKPPLYPGVGFSTDNSQRKVEIYTSNNEISRLGNYIGSTVAPYLFENSKEYHTNVVSSTIAPTSEEEYTQVYVNTPKFNVVQNQHDGGLVYGK